MSSGDKIHQQSLTALNNLITEIQPIIDRHTQEMSPAVANYLLTNYQKYLKINLQSDIEKRRVDSFSASPFDALIEDYHNGATATSTNKKSS